MRGGRNKFGPMYKRDRALKQQAMRQQQHLLANCQMRLVNGVGAVPEDIKPDPAMLYQLANSTNLNNLMYGSGSSPMSNMPSPSHPDSPPTDLSRVSMPASSSPVTTAAPQEHMQMVQSYPKMFTPLHTPYTSAPPHHTQQHQQPQQQQSQPHHPHHHHQHHHHQSHHINQHHHQMSPVATAPPTVIPVVPQLLTDFKGNMADENEIKQKLLTFLQSDFGQDDVLNQPQKLLMMICKLSDQLLFLMVEWARTSIFFKELKVSRITCTYTVKQGSKLFLR